MIILKLGLGCSFLFSPILIKNRAAKEIFLCYLSSLITLSLSLFIISGIYYPTLQTPYSDMIVALSLLLWIPTTYACYQRKYWSKFITYRSLLSVQILVLLIIFKSQRLFSLFIFFEISLVPIIVILFLGGNSEKKKEAGIYIFFFTSSSAIFFLVFLVFDRLGRYGNGLVITSIARSYIRSTTPISFNSFSMITTIIYNITTVVILVKTPLFFLHIWLPKAHVEAPVFASMILARLLLKTGGFGYLFLSTFTLGALTQFDWSICFIMILTVVAGLRCSTQTDVKVLIAYSSVNHISIMLVGIVSGIRGPTVGRMRIMLGHGVISSVLFFMARDRYNQIRTRRSFFSILLGKTNINMFAWLLFTIRNAGLPPFLIFTGEVILMKPFLIYPVLVVIFFINYLLIGYYCCLILLKTALSKTSIQRRTLVGVGLNPYISLSTVTQHFVYLVLLTIGHIWVC